MTTSENQAQSRPVSKSRRRMSTGNRILFFVTAWLIVLMPFLFWWNTWFGRQLSDKQLDEYLRDEKGHPRGHHNPVQVYEQSGQRGSAEQAFQVVRPREPRQDDERDENRSPHIQAAVSTAATNTRIYRHTCPPSFW